MTESQPFEMSEFINSYPNNLKNDKTINEVLRESIGAISNTHQDDHSTMFESFDHQYFEQEVQSLIKLRDLTEQERFNSRRYLPAHSTSRMLEQASLQEIE